MDFEMTSFVCNAGLAQLRIQQSKGSDEVAETTPLP